MILDTVSRLSRYAALNPLFLRVAEYLRRSDLNLMADGRYEISGEDAFLTLTRSSLRLSTEAPLEAHRLYADIQIVLSGEEGQTVEVGLRLEKRRFVHGAEGNLLRRTRHPVL